MRVAILVVLVPILTACARDPGDQGPTVATKNDGPSLVRLADNMLTAGDVTTAMAFYSQAAQQSPASPLPLVRFGDAALQAGDVEGAIRAYRSALVRDRTHRDAALGLARALLAGGRPAEAESVLAGWSETRGQTVDPVLARLRGVALDQQGRGEEAATIYYNALRTSKNDIDLMSNIALSHLVRGRVEESISLSQAIIEDPKAQVRHFANHVLILAFSGREDEAVRAVSLLLDNSTVQQIIAAGRRLAALPPGPERARAIGVSWARTEASPREATTP